MHAETFPELRQLYAVGADYVSIPRVGQAGELRDAILAAQRGLLGQQRAAQETLLSGRTEVLD